MRLNNKQRASIRNAIAAAESKTAGEVVTVIAQKSDRYRFVSLFWALLFSLMVVAVLPWLGVVLSAVYSMVLQLGIFLILWLIIDQTALKFFLLPDFIAQQRAHQKACEQFVACGVHLTENHTGILLFVSVAEHYVEVLADRGVYEAVPQTLWDTIVKDFIVAIKNKKIEQGFVDAIEACGTILGQHVPQKSNDKNELPDGLVEIE